MKVKFVLTMDDLVVDDQSIDQVVFDWESEMKEKEVVRVAGRWITSNNFLTQHMVGLSRVGESSLTIEPVELAAG